MQGKFDLFLLSQFGKHNNKKQSNRDSRNRIDRCVGSFHFHKAL